MNFLTDTSSSSYPSFIFSLVRSTVLLSLACCYTMWAIVYLAQLHPLIREYEHDAFDSSCPVNNGREGVSKMFPSI